MCRWLSVTASTSSWAERSPCASSRGRAACGSWLAVARCTRRSDRSWSAPGASSRRRKMPGWSSRRLAMRRRAAASCGWIRRCSSCAVTRCARDRVAACGSRSWREPVAATARGRARRYAAGEGGAAAAANARSRAHRARSSVGNPHAGARLSGGAGRRAGRARRGARHKPRATGSGRGARGPRRAPRTGSVAGRGSRFCSTQRGDAAGALALLADARSSPALLLAADLHAERGALARALTLVERVLARDIESPGARERHERWRRRLGAAAPLRRRAIDQPTLLRRRAARDESAHRRRGGPGRGGRGLRGARRRARPPGGAQGLPPRQPRSATSWCAKRETAVALAGPGVIRVFDVDPARGWIVMEWLPGGALKAGSRDAPRPRGFPRRSAVRASCRGGRPRARAPARARGHQAGERPVPGPSDARARVTSDWRNGRDRSKPGAAWATCRPSELPARRWLLATTSSRSDGSSTTCSTLWTGRWRADRRSRRGGRWRELATGDHGGATG